LGQKLIEGGRKFEGAWNFGPERSGNRTVAEVLGKLHTHWPDMQWQKAQTQQPHEANLLYLDSSKAHSQLGWQSVWSLETTLEKTANWYRIYLNLKKTISTQQLSEYLDAAKKAQVGWISL
jgi:CDP-glucose 4,6-dehydratase